MLATALILALASLTSLSAHAEIQKQVIEIEGRKIPFISRDQDRLLIDEKCFSRPDKMKCQAYAALLKASQIKLKADADQGGANPGALLCHAMPKTEVVYSVDKNGDQNSFCEFP